MAPKVKKRRPLVAALLSLLMPGLGQLYAGRPIRAVVFIAIATVADTLGSYRLLPLDDLPLLAYATEAFVALVILALAFWIVSIVDATVVARQAGTMPLHAYQRWYVYLGLLIILSVPGLLGDRESLRPIANYGIPSASMLPTMMPGDSVLGPNRWYQRHEPERGQLAVYVLPNEQVTYVSRIVGLPGDLVQMREGRLYLNGELVPRERLVDVPILDLPSAVVYRETLPGGSSYQIVERGDSQPLDDTEFVTVPPGHYFMMSDNRDDVRDSRYIGPVARERLEARPVLIWWSRDWGRIGRKLE